MTTERLEKLKQLLAQHPADAFVLFALGMEMVSKGRLDDSVAYFDRLLEIDSEYVPAYYQKAKVLARLGRYTSACETLQAGLPHADRAAQFHTRDKMRDLFDELQNAICRRHEPKQDSD